MNKMNHEYEIATLREIVLKRAKENKIDLHESALYDVMDFTIASTWDIFIEALEAIAGTEENEEN